MVPHELSLAVAVIDPSTLGGDMVVSTGNMTRSHDFRIRIVGDEAEVPAGFYRGQLIVTAVTPDVHPV